MSILVVCSGCRSRFQVSDKFAGKSGACPKCKATIQVPTKEQEVKIHGGEEFADGGRNAAGQLVIKPIARQETEIKPLVVAGIVAAVLAVLAAAWLGGRMTIGEESRSIWSYLAARVVGLLVVSPPLVLAAYTFLRDDELEPYRGRELYLRLGICAVAYTALWGVFAIVAGFGLIDEMWSWLYVAPPLVIVGALTALACFDLDFGSGCFHYSFYLLATLVLRWAAGLGWIWQAG